MHKHKIIENIISESSYIAFILESPHIDEICKGYPLAGKAGKEMSKYLLDSKIPFGEEVKKGKLANKVSVINVSKKPLSSKAYCCNSDVPRDIENYEKLKELIDNNANFNTTHYNQELNDLKSEIYDSFIKEIIKVPNKSFIVPCGKFARDCIDKAKEEDIVKNKQFKYIDSAVPHPARNKWINLEEDTLRKIKKYLDRG